MGQYKSYAEKLQDPRWQLKRLELIKLSGLRCENAGCSNASGISNDSLHVHHRVYLKGFQPWEYEDWAYRVLCESCHKKEQVKMEKAYILLAKNHFLMELFAMLSEWTPDEVEEFSQDLYMIFSNGEAKDICGLILSLQRILDSSTSLTFQRGVAFGKK